MDYNKFFDKINLCNEGRCLFYKLNERLSVPSFKRSVYDGYDAFKKGNETFEHYVFDFASKENVLPEEMHLYLTVIYAEGALIKMEKLGIPDEYFYGSFHYVAVNCSELIKKRGICGLDIFELPWFRYSLEADLYYLGRLEYQIAKSEYDVDFGEYSIKKGDRVLFVHIPGNKPLTEEACTDSYSKALEFFGKYYGMEKLPCFCYTWILQPWIADVLSPTSNVIKFKNTFKLLETIQSIPHTFRFIFEDQYENIDDYPTDKPLRKVAVERRKNNEFIGYGVGVRLVTKDTYSK